MGGVAARRLRLAMAFVVAVALLAACDLGSKQELADRVDDARHVETGARAASFTLAVRPKRLPANVAEGLPGGGQYAAAQGALDTGRGVSTVAAPPEVAARIAALSGQVPTPGAGAPVLIYARGNAVVVRRPAREVVAARPWYRLDLEDVREVTRPRVSTIITARHPSDLAVLTPSFMVDLLAGVLAGSVEQRGETIHGRLSIDKANREDDLDDDAIKARAEALRLFAISDDVHDFTLQLDDQGAIRALAVEFVLKPDKQTRFELEWSMKVAGASPRITWPRDAESIRVSSFNQLRGAIAGWAAP